LAWAEPGKTAISFQWAVGGHIWRVVCIGNWWYKMYEGDEDSWYQWGPIPDFQTTYVGSTEKLREHVRAILAGREVTITARMPTSPVGPLLSSFDYHHPACADWTHGKKGRVWRIKASLKIDKTEDVSTPDSSHFVGWGIGGAGAVPSLVAG